MRAIRRTISVAAIATALCVWAQPTTTQAHPAGRPVSTPTVLTTAVSAPFNLAVDHGKLLIADGPFGAPGQIGMLAGDGTVSTVVGNVPGASGVATHRGSLAYTMTVGDQNGISASGLNIRKPNGSTILADTLAYETAHNPDQASHYGVTDPSSCVSDALSGAGFPVSYTGVVDSHAYSVTGYGRGWIVADAGANALLKVSSTGEVSTLAVLPPQPSKITKAAADQFHLDPCVIGVSYAFEPVPTDVEVGPNGFLYVTLLPGGPEDTSLGARGSLIRVNPHTGRIKVIATGLSGATNLAISEGKFYVTELFAGRVSLVRHGRARAHIDLPGALSIEAGPRGILYAGTGVFGPSSVVRINPRTAAWLR